MLAKQKKFFQMRTRKFLVIHQVLLNWMRFWADDSWPDRLCYFQVSLELENLHFHCK